MAAIVPAGRGWDRIVSVREANRWSELTGGTGGAAYAERFAALAAKGADVHGEASLCARLAPAGGRILDAGCGTGRVAIRLAGLGFSCVGVDSDESMLARARTCDAVRWILADLAALDGATDVDGPFDLIVAAGNVVALLAPGTEPAVVSALASRLPPGGLLVAGFGLDAAHLPIAAPPFGLAEYDAWCAKAGLGLSQRFATWDRDPFDDAGYAVSVHERR